MEDEHERACGEDLIREDGLRVLGDVAGFLRLEVLDWKNEELCCGFGGTFSVKMPDVSVAMADEKLTALEESGADTLVSCDSSCLMHLGGRLRKQGRETRVMHLAEVLDPKRGKVG